MSKYTHDERAYIIQAMCKYGGGFASRLGEALRHADRFNTARIEDAFPELFERYHKMAIQMKERENNE